MSIRAVVLISLILATSCSSASEPPGYVIDLKPAPDSDAVPLTVGEAGNLAGGALVEIYGLEADPVPIRLESDRKMLSGQTVWRLNLVVDVTIEGTRTTRDWTMWVGTPDTGPPTVLRALPAEG